MSTGEKSGRVRRLAAVAVLLFGAAFIGGWFLQQYSYQNLPKAEFSLITRELSLRSDKPYSFNNTNPTMTVKTGTLVQIILDNNGSIIHDFVIEELGVHLFPDVEPNHQGAVTFFASRLGTYTYFCSIPGHRLLGMEGQLVIN